VAGPTTTSGRNRRGQDEKVEERTRLAGVAAEIRGCWQRTSAITASLPELSGASFWPKRKWFKEEKFPELGVLIQRAEKDLYRERAFPSFRLDFVYFFNGLA